MRDSSGAVIGALSVPTFLGSLIAEFEVLACLRAMQFALEIGLTWVIFEGDSAAMINALDRGWASWPAMGMCWMISELIFLISSSVILI